MDSARTKTSNRSTPTPNEDLPAEIARDTSYGSLLDGMIDYLTSHPGKEFNADDLRQVLGYHRGTIIHRMDAIIRVHIPGGEFRTYRRGKRKVVKYQIPNYSIIIGDY